jgi:hypothetical protein
MRPLAVDLSDPSARPYFLWDEDISVAELRAALRPQADQHERMRLMGKLLREARDLDVWSFEEIFANKLTTVLSRSEERDLVDLLLLEREGLRTEDGLAGAHAKDGGCTAAALAFVLSEVSIPDSVVLPAGVSPNELRSFVNDQIVRLRRIAFPTQLAP